MLSQRLVDVLHGLDLCVGELALGGLVCALAVQHVLPPLVHLDLVDHALAGVDAHVHGRAYINPGCPAPSAIALLPLFLPPPPPLPCRLLLSCRKGTAELLNVNHA
jgi:hypothetical protein